MFLDNNYKVIEHYTSSIYENVDYSYENELYSDRYNEFIENESKYVKVDTHISIDDIMFASNMSSYIETDSIITTSVIDITDLNNVFKVKDMFFINKEYKVCPAKFTGKPKIPKYHKKGGYNVAVISNDPVKLKDGMLSLPDTDIKIDVSKMLENIKSDYDLTLLNIKIKIEYGKVFLKLTFEERVGNKEVKVSEKDDNKRYAAIDLGINNLATIVNNIGNSPILIKGGYIKAYNRNVNKKISELQSTLKKVNNSYNSKQINRLWEKRDIFFKNEFGRISNQIIKYLIDNNINTLIIGKNEDWKRGINLGSKNNQNFAYIPFNNLIFMLEYKCKANGIKFVEVEESYTSKASFLDKDKIPTFGKNDADAKFSGTRIKRGLYKSKKGILINADVNGACNILRKYKKSAFKTQNTKYLLNVSRM